MAETKTEPGYDKSKERVLITGALGDIGSEVSRFYMEKGIDVLLVDCDDTRKDTTENTLKELLGFASNHDVHAKYSSVDLREPYQMDRFIDGVERDYGTLAHLINVAGKPDWEEVRNGFLGSSDPSFDNMMRTNLIGPLELIRRAAPLIAKDSHPLKSVIVIGSISGDQSWMYQAGYAASKRALTGFVLGGAGEFGDYGREKGGVPIRLFAVVPGTVRAAASKDGRDYSRMENGTATGRLATPRDIAGACYACSHLLENSTGLLLPVDGGQSIQRVRPKDIK